MEELRTIIGDMVFPIELPRTAFAAQLEIMRLIDMGAIIDALPASLQKFIDRELTITNISANTFALPLNDGRYLFVKVKDTSIIGVEVVSRH